MSCNGCRMLRKGCSGYCILRSCLQWMESSKVHGYATVLLAKFFGRAGLMGFISAVTEDQRPVGLLQSGNWQICEAAVDTVLKDDSRRLMSPSSSLPSNLSDSLLYSRAFAMPEKLSLSLAGRVHDPTTVMFPLSLNVSADTTLNPCTINLGHCIARARRAKGRTMSKPDPVTYRVSKGWSWAGAT
uniref:LOB domain-containing protein n=1 Tax=Physcomitrium patens TaxID=3218 RepID=A0A2K1J6P1_PHYPA|nr:hypothetical protein PHYPA_020298 [Physcomitrium patens]